MVFLAAASVGTVELRLLVENLMLEHQRLAAVHFPANIARPVLSALDFVLVHVFFEL